MVAGPDMQAGRQIDRQAERLRDILPLLLVQVATPAKRATDLCSTDLFLNFVRHFGSLLLHPQGERVLFQSFSLSLSSSLSMLHTRVSHGF